MRPYQRKKRVPLRFRDDIKFDKFGICLTTANRAVSTLLMDVQGVWMRDPPFPASLRIILSVFLVWIFFLPLLYLLVPPLFTALTILWFKYDNPIFFLELPAIPAEQRRGIYHLLIIFIKKAVYRLSMVVTLYDYVQTFRAIGVFNFDD